MRLRLRLRMRFLLALAFVALFASTAHALGFGLDDFGPYVNLDGDKCYFFRVPGTPKLPTRFPLGSPFEQYRKPWIVFLGDNKDPYHAIPRGRDIVSHSFQVFFDKENPNKIIGISEYLPRNESPQAFSGGHYNEELLYSEPVQLFEETGVPKGYFEYEPGHPKFEYLIEHYFKPENFEGRGVLAVSQVGGEYAFLAQSCTIGGSVQLNGGRMLNRMRMFGLNGFSVRFRDQIQAVEAFLQTPAGRLTLRIVATSVRAGVAVFSGGRAGAIWTAGALRSAGSWVRMNLVRLTRFGGTRVPYVGAASFLLLAVNFALHAGHDGLQATTIGFGVGMVTSAFVTGAVVGAAWLAGRVISANAAGACARWVGSRFIPVVGWVLLALDTFLIGASYYYGVEITWGKIWDVITGEIDKPTVIAGPTAPDENLYLN